MNRFAHFLRARTLYGVHSPFVYRLYTECLFARVRGRGRSYGDVVWRLERYYGVQCSGGEMRTDDGLIRVVERPHRDEGAWQAMVADGRWQVTIDLYSVGLAVANPKLSKQHFLLR
ncbi:MAG: hypothetical protein IJU19_05190 [Bacteroidales bacterium]|nr:hypothetical protein [Bacteroidales bacterium]